MMIILGAVVLGAIGAGTYMLVSPAASPQSPVVDSVVITPTQAPAKLIFWKDPAGFTFSYPDGVVIDKHDEDTTNYAHIEMTHPSHPGKLIVWAKDLPKGVTDAASWVKKDATYAGAVLLDTTLGDIAAKKVLLTQPEKKMVVGTVADGLLFYVEGVLSDEAYWQQAVDTVSQSFAIKPVDQPAQGGSVGAQEVSVDEEEVLE